ncbi:MAG: hypothetical protein JXA42_07540 [Anaerolineales bacterium]|nr:hypothetical protein [Anaerolineales bacterium]
MKISVSTGPDRNPSAVSGFTLTDFLAVLGCLFLLITTLWAASPTNSKAAICLNNLRQLMTATTIYAADNADFLPPNPDDANTVTGHNWIAGSMRNPMQATNVWLTTHSNLLAKYLGHDPRPFKYHRCAPAVISICGILRQRPCAVSQVNSPPHFPYMAPSRTTTGAIIYDVVYKSIRRLIRHNIRRGDSIEPL